MNPAANERTALTGRLLRIARTRACISLREAGLASGLGATRISSIELGWSRPRTKELALLVELYAPPVKTLPSIDDLELIEQAPSAPEEGSAGE